MATNHVLRSKIGGILRRHRKLKNLSIKDLAEKVGVSPSSVTTLEITGSISIDMLYRYAQAMDCEVKDLIPTMQQMCEVTVPVNFAGNTYDVSEDVAAQIVALLKGETEQ